MTKILTTAEHNQATADLATLTAIVENYAVTHPKNMAGYPGRILYACSFRSCCWIPHHEGY